MTEISSREELDLIQASIARLRADLVAAQTALEAVMTGLPHAHQRQVLEHLRHEADQVEQSFGQSSSPTVQAGAQQHAKALRGLAGMLEAQHLRALQQQWAEAASPEFLSPTDPFVRPTNAERTD